MKGDSVNLNLFFLYEFDASLNEYFERFNLEIIKTT